MKTFLTSFLILLSAPIVLCQTIELSEMEGKWFVNQSNFPMWLKGNKTNPSFNYSSTTKDSNQKLLDEVVFTKNSNEKSIVGFDKPTNSDNTSFIWRGKGLLLFVRSKWTILQIDDEKQWMIIHFEKTLFTPEGYDVISRLKSLSMEMNTEIEQKLVLLGIKEKLTTIHQE